MSKGMQDMSYSKRLRECREEYPFKYWLEDYKEGIGCYSEHHCLKVQSIFDELIESLVKLEEVALESQKVELFEYAVKCLNLIRKTNPRLIETMQREEFCDLFDVVALAAGLKPENYGNGEGIASEWRSW